MKSVAQQKNALICPMIDARRNEVFTALYTPSPVIGHPSSVIDESSATDGHRSSVIGYRSPVSAALTELLPPQALILDKTSFETELSQNLIVFFGSGAEKWEKISVSPNALFESQYTVIHAFATLAQQDFQLKKWADTIYSEPVYLKEFFSY